ncbi:hypothetical protein GCM10023068_43700 [Leifsonia shinshuensis]
MGADNLHLEKSPKGYVMDLSQEEARRLRILAALFELAGHHTASDVSLAELNDKLIQCVTSVRSICRTSVAA